MLKKLLKELHEKSAESNFATLSIVEEIIEIMIEQEKEIKELKDTLNIFVGFPYKLK